MHRTTADGHVIENGKRRFENQDLPLKPGTADTAGYNNAVQEELCNIVELTGGTLATDENTDRNGGWRQVYDAIFKGGNIGVDAIGTLNGRVTWDNGVAKTEVAGGGVEMNSGASFGVVSTYQVSVREQAVPAPVAAQTAITKKGITFHGTNHVSQTVATPYAWATFELPSALKHLGIPPSTSTAAVIGFTLSRADPTDPAIQLPVPATLPILAAHVRYTAAGGVVCTVPALMALTPSHACTDINVICDAQPASPFLPPDLTKPITITVMYDASAI